MVRSGANNEAQEVIMQAWPNRSCGRSSRDSRCEYTDDSMNETELERVGYDRLFDQKSITKNARATPENVNVIEKGDSSNEVSIPRFLGKSQPPIAQSKISHPRAEIVFRREYPNVRGLPHDLKIGS